MNIIKSITTTIILICAATAAAQTLTKKEWEDIKKSGQYLIGTGQAQTLRQAEQDALVALSGQISTSVSTRFDYVIGNDDTGQGNDAGTKMNYIVQSYTHNTLKGVRQYIEKKEPGAIVHKYLKLSDLETAFRQRIDKARMYAREAAKCERDMMVGDALQKYYWALALLRSCPDGNLERIQGADYESYNMATDIQSKVNYILGGITIEAVSVQDDEDTKNVRLNVMYNGKPARNLAYKYYTGSEYSDPYNVKDGQGFLELPKSASVKKLELQIDYECRSAANIDPELHDVLEYTDPVPFPQANVKVDAGNMKKVKKDKSQIELAQTLAPQTANATNAAATGSVDTGALKELSEEEAAGFLPTMQALEQAIRNRNYESVRHLFTTDGYQMFESLIHYGKARLLGEATLSFTRFQDEVICRSLPMIFSFENNRRKFVEDVVVHIDNTGKICELAFGLDRKAQDDIFLRMGGTDVSRHIIANFLERYKTAYALKRLDYLEQIFSQDALIITGRVVKSSGNRELGTCRPEHVRYTRLTKKEYMKKLTQTFAANQFINIHFSDNIVKRTNYKDKEVFGIQIQQDYYSTHYGDTGYLFLMLDLRNSKQPMILVRAWQPDLDNTVKDGRLSLSDFEWD